MVRVMQRTSTRLTLVLVTYDKAVDVSQMDADNIRAVALAHHERSESISYCSKPAITHSITAHITVNSDQ